MNFEPSRLALARRRRGWKRTELGRRAGIPVRTIIAYELGERTPPDDSLAELARALEFPKEFFFQRPVECVQDTGVSFRALTKMSAMQRDRALAAGELALELADWAASRFVLPSPDVPDLHGEASPEAAAIALRAAWGLSDRPIGDLVRLLESKGIRVFSLAEPDRSLDGFSFWRAGEPFVFLNTLKSAERSRFDAAHELGHLVLHRHGQAMGRKAEQEAMQFASAFLMPAPSIRVHAPRPPSLPTLIQAKRWWGVSVSALVHRMYDLELISEWHYRTLCIQMQQEGFRSKEPNPMPRELSQIWAQVFDGLRGEGLRRTDLAKLLAWPTRELQALVFQLVLSAESGGQAASHSPTPPPEKRESIRLVR